MRETQLTWIKGVALAMSIAVLTACGESDGIHVDDLDAAAAENETGTTESPSGTASAGGAKGGSAGQVSEPAEAGRSGTYGDLVYGDENAPVTVIEYASYTCPACAYWAAEIFPKLEEKYIETGKVKFIFRNFVRDRVDLAAAMTARCSTRAVAKQLTRVYFERQQEWMQSQDVAGSLATLARRAGISRADFDQCLADVAMRDHIVEITQSGDREFNIAGTPTIIVNGRTISNSWEDLDEAISDAL